MRKSLVLISALAALAIGPSPADAKGQKGKAGTSEIHVTHKVDKASPTIMSKSTGKSKSKYMTYQLKDATISSFGSSERKSGSSGNVKGSTSQPSGRR
jgi:type VI protein secretion system component Hcp